MNATKHALVRDTFVGGDAMPERGQSKPSVINHKAAKARFQGARQCAGGHKQAERGARAPMKTVMTMMMMPILVIMPDPINQCLNLHAWCLAAGPKHTR